MKKIALLVLFSVSVCAYTQSFKLFEVIKYVDEETTYEEGDEIANGSILTQTCQAQEDEHGNLEAYGETYAVLENTSNEDKVVVCKRVIVQRVGGAVTYFCWSTCNDTNFSIDEKLVEAGTKTGVVDFSTHYTAPSTAGTSIVRYTFYDKDNIGDSISVVYEFITPPDLRIRTCFEGVSLSVYPNPAVDYLNVEVNGLPLKPISVVLYDAVGKKVKTLSMTSNSSKVSVSNLEQGVYYLQIFDDNRMIGFRQFVKE